MFDFIEQGILLHFYLCCKHIYPEERFRDYKFDRMEYEATTSITFPTTDGGLFTEYFNHKGQNVIFMKREDGKEKDWIIEDNMWQIDNERIFKEINKNKWLISKICGKG